MKFNIYSNLPLWYMAKWAILKDSLFNLFIFNGWGRGGKKNISLLCVSQYSVDCQNSYISENFVSAHLRMCTLHYLVGTKFYLKMLIS